MGSRSTRKKKKAAAKKAAVNVQVQATKAAEAEVKAEKEVKAAEAKAAEKMEAAAEVKAADTEIKAEKEVPAAAADTEAKAGKEAEAADTEAEAGKEAEAADIEVKAEKEAEVEASESGSESESKPEVEASEQISVSETAEPEPVPVPDSEAPDADTQDRDRRDPAFVRRFERHFDELKWLYIELYENDSMFAELCDNIHRFYKERNKDLKKLDREREEDPNWYKNNDMLGMMLYIDNFAGNMKGVQEKLDYLEKCNVNYIHLMPFLDTVEGRSDADMRWRISVKCRKD